MSSPTESGPGHCPNPCMWPGLRVPPVCPFCSHQVGSMHTPLPLILPQWSVGYTRPPVVELSTQWAAVWPVKGLGLPSPRKKAALSCPPPPT